MERLSRERGDRIDVDADDHAVVPVDQPECRAGVISGRRRHAESGLEGVRGRRVDLEVPGRSSLQRDRLLTRQHRLEAQQPVRDAQGRGDAAIDVPRLVLGPTVFRPLDGRDDAVRVEEQFVRELRSCLGDLFVESDGQSCVRLVRGGRLVVRVVHGRDNVVVAHEAVHVAVLVLAVADSVRKNVVGTAGALASTNGVAHQVLLDVVEPVEEDYPACPRRRGQVERSDRRGGIQPDTGIGSRFGRVARLVPGAVGRRDHVVVGRAVQDVGIGKLAGEHTAVDHLVGTASGCPSLDGVAEKVGLAVVIPVENHAAVLADGDETSGSLGRRLVVSGRWRREGSLRVPSDVIELTSSFTRGAVVEDEDRDASVVPGSIGVPRDELAVAPDEGPAAFGVAGDSNRDELRRVVALVNHGAAAHTPADLVDIDDRHRTTARAVRDPNRGTRVRHRFRAVLRPACPQPHLDRPRRLPVDLCPPGGQAVGLVDEVEQTAALTEAGGVVAEHAVRDTETWRRAPVDRPGAELFPAVAPLSEGACLGGRQHSVLIELENVEEVFGVDAIEFRSPGRRRHEAETR